MTIQQQHQETDFSRELAAKPFFKIGEVARLVGLKPHVIRYWETEFATLAPKKNPSGQRIYVKADVEAIVEIKNLLYNKRYTISGAKQMLARQNEGMSRNPSESESQTAHMQALTSLKEHVCSLLKLLEQKPNV